MGRRTVVVAALAVVAALGAVWWWWPGEERAVGRRLDALAREFNESTSDGLGTIARAARLGSYFTDDVTVDLGKGSAPISGRETLVGMAARLQPRTSPFEIRFVDVTPTISEDGASADVSLTVEFIRRAASAADDDALDAREFDVRMVKSEGEWRIARVTSVSPFRS